MSLTFYFHPLASFCHKALIALYENGTAFESVIVDLGDAGSSAAFRKIWPMAKMPVLRDETRGKTVAESTIVIEYLDRFYSGGRPLIPQDPDQAWQARFWDRFFDNYLQFPMQKIVLDHLRAEADRDRFGAEQARAQLAEAYDVVEAHMTGHEWALGESFTLADCSAAPALFYANTVYPVGPDRTNTSDYLRRLMLRPSFARALKEAEPYLHMFPLDKKPVITPPAS